MQIPFSRSARLGAVMLASWAGALGAKPLPVTEGPSVELPEFTVTGKGGLPEPEPWRIVAWPGFEVLSTAPDRRTRRLLENYLKFNEALALVWPVPRPPTEPPIRLIICGRGDVFTRFTGPVTGPVPTSGAATLLLRRGADTAIVVDYQTKALPFSIRPLRFRGTQFRFPFSARSNEEDMEEDHAEEMELDEDETSLDHVRELSREYVRVVLTSQGARPPAWFEEGLAQILAGIELNRGSIVVAKLRTSSELSVDEEGGFNIVLRHQKLIPLAQFFSVSHDAPQVRNPIGSVWVHQAHAFAHFCLYGERGRRQQAFVNFVRRAMREPVTEEVFRDCFGLTFREMEKELRRYVLLPRSQYQRFTLGKGEEIKAPQLAELRDATPDEVGRLLGESLALAGHEAAAHRELRLAYARGARHPRVLGGLGLAELATGRKERAWKLINAAVDARVDRAEPYLALARQRLSEAPERIGSAAAANVLKVLFAARQYAPPHAEVYRTIADVWRRCTVEPTSDHLAPLYEGMKHFPRDQALARALLELEKRVGHEREARELETYLERLALAADRSFLRL